MYVQTKHLLLLFIILDANTTCGFKCGYFKVNIFVSQITMLVVVVYI